MDVTRNTLADLLIERSGRPYDLEFKQELKLIIDYWSPRIIKESLEKRPKDRMYLLKHFNAKLIKEDKIVCPIEADCDVLRTELQVPQPIRANGILFDYVGSADREYAFTYVQPEHIVFLKEATYTGKKIRWTFVNKYIYILNTLSPKYIGVRLIPENQDDLCDFDCSSVVRCDSDDEPYAIPKDLVPVLIRAILTQELRININEDKQEVEINEKK